MDIQFAETPVIAASVSPARVFVTSRSGPTLKRRHSPMSACTRMGGLTSSKVAAGYRRPLSRQQPGGPDRQIADPDTDCSIDRIGDRGRNAGGAEFANAASAGRACKRVEFVDEMHLNVGSRAGKCPPGSSTASAHMRYWLSLTPKLAPDLAPVELLSR